MQVGEAEIAKGTAMTNERNARQIEEIKEGLREATSGAAGVSHREVEDWVRSWGTEKELKRPRAEKQYLQRKSSDSEP